MRSDRYLKAVLTVIAVALCVLALPQMETAEVMAAYGQPELAAEGQEIGARSASGQQAGMSLVEESRATTQGPATLPLRWHVTHAVEMNGGLANTYCATTVLANNMTSSSVGAQVEWFDHSGSSLGYSSGTVLSKRSFAFFADTDINPQPFLFLDNTSADLGDFAGYATVHADDPRIMVSAYLVCRTGSGWSAALLGIMPIKAFPVGATMEIFQAAIPATGTPPVVVPEVPE